MKIALDAMGGDNAPYSVIEGALAALQENNLEIILVGREDQIKREVIKFGNLPPRLSIKDAKEVINMDDSATEVLKNKKNSSISVALGLIKLNKADAVVSAGHSGATMAASLTLLDKLEGIERPAIAVLIPTKNGRSVLLDAGANVNCKPYNLIQFAILGSIYARCILGFDNPRIGLLSNGTEETKGTPLIQNAHKLLKQTKLNYAGYLEGFDVFNGEVEVVVCDGFTGNIFLKTGEGIVELFSNLFRAEVSKRILTRLGLGLAKKSLSEFKKKLDYKESGGAPLLGINGSIIICHGKSDAETIKNAINLAVKFVNKNMNKFIINDLKESYDLYHIGQKGTHKIWGKLKERIIHHN
ncbi:MAG: phosphate acyltransferase PlsX [Thermodesulfobacteriota bacterium]|nr:phosphate acyltransferase PlsX [Thermodesulfobacteriota bacterium]